MDNLPHYVHIGQHTYDIVSDENSWVKIQKEEAERGELLGMLRSEQLAIYLSPEQAATQKADTLLHEVLHAICISLGLVGVLTSLRKSADIEEVLVGLLTPVLHQVLHDNEDLYTFLMDPEGSGE
jgi:hypothetical protein